MSVPLGCDGGQCCLLETVKSKKPEVLLLYSICLLFCFQILKQQDKSKQNHKHFLQPSGKSSEEQEVLLFRTDQSGRAWPVNAPSGPHEPHGGRRKKKPVREGSGYNLRRDERGEIKNFQFSSGINRKTNPGKRKQLNIKNNYKPKQLPERRNVIWQQQMKGTRSAVCSYSFSCQRLLLS